MYPACSRSGNCRCPWDGLVQALTYTRTRQVGWLALWHGDCVVVGTVGHCRRRSRCQRSAVGGRSWPPVVNRGHHRRRSPSSVVVIVACVAVDPALRLPLASYCCSSHAPMLSFSFYSLSYSIVCPFGARLQLSRLLVRFFRSHETVEKQRECLDCEIRRMCWSTAPPNMTRTSCRFLRSARYFLCRSFLGREDGGNYGDVRVHDTATLENVMVVLAVSYTHLTLPTNREV